MEHKTKQNQPTTKTSLDKKVRSIKKIASKKEAITYKTCKDCRFFKRCNKHICNDDVETIQCTEFDS